MISFFIFIIKLISYIIFNILKWIFSTTGSQIIYNLGLGFGAFIGAIAGIKIIEDWIKERKRQKLIRYYAKIYPSKTYNNTSLGWELTRNPDIDRQIFLIDHNNKTRHWIANYDTFLDLGLHQEDATITEEKKNSFNSYTHKDNILTVGVPEY